VRSEEGAGEMRVTVNVSPNQLTKGDLPAIVRRALEEAALPAHALVLEITETTPLDTMPEAVEVLRALYAIGVGIALDDFGTGFTRLDLIHDLPLDAVKIDRTFVHRFLDNAIDRDIIEMIVALAQRRGLTVIAEGVETVEQADLLARVGCSHAQGFLFGQPVDVDELRYLLREWQIVPAIATSRSLKRFAP
jgi:EAL domain-containing protein (putative c-di-GMP-specific phosphodiesterase class I)